MKNKYIAASLFALLTLLLVALPVIGNHCERPSDAGAQTTDTTFVANYRHRASLWRVRHVGITDTVAYRLEVDGQPIRLNADHIDYRVVNVCGPTATNSYDFGVSVLLHGQWMPFTLQDGIGFADVGRSAEAGRSFSEHISLDVYNQHLTRAPHRLDYLTLCAAKAHCNISKDSITPADSTVDECGHRNKPMYRVFDIRVLSTRADTISVYIANHSGHTLHIDDFPQIYAAAPDMPVHPYFTGASQQETAWLKRHATIRPGEGMIINLTNRWDTRRFGSAYAKHRYRGNRLAPGTYSVYVMYGVELHAPFSLE